MAPIPIPNDDTATARAMTIAEIVRLIMASVPGEMDSPSILSPYRTINKLFASICFDLQWQEPSFLALFRVPERYRQDCAHKVARLTFGGLNFTFRKAGYDFDFHDVHEKFKNLTWPALLTLGIDLRDLGKPNVSGYFILPYLICRLKRLDLRYNAPVNPIPPPWMSCK